MTAPAPAHPVDPAAETAAWDAACDAARLAAIDPRGLGGVLVRARPGPSRDVWLGWLAALMPADAPARRAPTGISVERLTGGLDLSATLAAGRPVGQAGLLAEAHGGRLEIAMAERMAPIAAATIASALDEGEVRAERDGLSLRAPAVTCVVALDEGVDEEAAPAALAERLAFHIDLDAVSARVACAPADARGDVAAARARLPSVAIPESMIAALCEAAEALGVASPRATILACAAARAAAALAGRDAVDAEDAGLAASLVLAPRATRLPAAQEDVSAEPEADDAADDGPQDAPEPPPPEADADPDAPADMGDAAGRDMVVEAARAAIPKGLLDRLSAGLAAGRASSRAAGVSGAARRSMTRGRPMGARRGELRPGVRLDLVETLRAAAPWQPLRRAAGAPADRIAVRADDIRIRRYQERAESVAIFVVDASGSSAFARLAEAKGAVELLLADCYVRRDQVAMIAFRGGRAELLLAPTRSLVRAKRNLAGLQGGGGTPLASAVDAAAMLAQETARKGRTPIVVMMTDGEANVARDGTPGRPRAAEDVIDAAKRFRISGTAGLLIDTAARPRPKAAALAEAMGVGYLPLPFAGSAAMAGAIDAVIAGGGRR